jgi:hypothetical protein
MDWQHGRDFDHELYQRSLERALAVGTPPYLAVIPDAPGNARKTLAMAGDWLPRLPDFPWYLAVQDGMNGTDVEPLVDRIAGIFLGGTNGFKATAAYWRAFAHTHRLPFHYGRAGTEEKVRHALHVGADSLDSAFPMWTMDRWQRFERWVTDGPDQQDLFRKAEGD